MAIVYRYSFLLDWFKNRNAILDFIIGCKGGEDEN